MSNPDSYTMNYKATLTLEITGNGLDLLTTLTAYNACRSLVYLSVQIGCTLKATENELMKLLSNGLVCREGEKYTNTVAGMLLLQAGKWDVETIRDGIPELTSNWRIKQ